MRLVTGRHYNRQIKTTNKSAKKPPLEGRGKTARRVAVVEKIIQL